jgi:hypothetical protein
VLRLAQPAQVLGEAEPGGLTDVGRVRRGKSKRACDGPDTAGEALDERVPCLFIAARSGSDELCDSGDRRDGDLA